MNKKINLILSQVLENVKPSEKELNEIEKSLKDFLKKLEEKIQKQKISAEIFVGGSFAKRTLIRKGKYDIDIFLRFKDGGEISELTEKLLKSFKNVSRIHGSRDYFRVKADENLFFEIIPVVKITTPKEAENITDLSYSHVKYINKKIKSEKIIDEIRIAKAFCHVNKCYGAESYVSGFSGYGLELLIYHYKSFLKFVKEIRRINEKLVIDIEKCYRNKNVVLMDLNSSKLQSPIVLVDPTFKQRNVLAALSNETLEKFQKACKKFLKNPSLNQFKIQKTDFEKIKKETEKKKLEFILLKAETSKPAGSVAGSKLLKFHRHLAGEIKKFFEIKKRGFEYSDGEQSAKFYFAVKKKKEILIKGPSIKDEKNSERFKKMHKLTFVKSGRIHAREKIDFKLSEFINSWKKKNKDKIIDMFIKELEIV